MARARRARATTTEGRFLASRIQDAKRRGATNAQIARAFGINERTVRKIRSGETTGTRTFGRLVEPSQKEPAKGASPSIVRVDIKLGKDAAGNDVVRTVNARLPTVPTRTGKRVAATPADIFRIPGLAALVEREIERMERQYGNVVIEGRGGVVSIRPIAMRRKPLRIEITSYAS